MTKITVFGGGSFATALGFSLAKNAHEVVLLTRNEQQAETISTKHYNPNYLSDFVLPNNMWATTDPKKALGLL
jgi:glycerol-3-phosphate dehydrogenase (NAD(P)+)